MAECEAGMSAGKRRNKKDRDTKKSTEPDEVGLWLRNAPPGVVRFIGEMTHRQSLAYVRKLYKLGVTKLTATEIDITGVYESVGAMNASLPDDQAMRQAIFEFEAVRVEKMGFDMEPDKGQRELFIWCD